VELDTLLRRRIRRAPLVFAAVLCVTSLALPVAGASTPAATDSAVDKKGVLRQGVNLDNLQGTHFDPVQSPTVADRLWMQLVIGTLLRENAQGGFDGMLAKSVEVVDPQTVKVTLRPNITYTDGAELTAEAVRASLLRTKNEPATEAVRAGQHNGIKYLQDVVVDGPLELTVTLNAPAAAEFVPALASREGTIVSPKQLAEAPQEIDTNPAGAGPFVLEEFEPLRVLSLRKNPDYWDAKRWKLGGIDFVHTPATGPALVQGLLSDAVDLIGGAGVATVAEGDAERIAATPGYAVAKSSSEFSYLAMVLCTGQPPFDNPDLRKALQIGIDREALNDLVYNGQYEPGYGLWPVGNKNFNPKTKKLLQTNLKKAKKLVADSGVSDPTFDVYYPGQVDFSKVLEAIQAQLAEVGFKMNIMPSRDVVTEFIQANKPGALFIPGSRTGVDKYGRVFAPGSQQVLCGVAHPEIMEVVNKTAALDPNDPETAKLFQQAELMIAENGWVVPVIYTQAYTGYNRDTIGGTPKFSGIRGELLYDSIYMKKGD
jgi:peptide/nickel transport system substrate-binding protein